MRSGEKSRNFLAHFFNKEKSIFPGVFPAFTFSFFFSAGMLRGWGGEGNLGDAKAALFLVWEGGGGESRISFHLNIQHVW